MKHVPEIAAGETANVSMHVRVRALIPEVITPFKRKNVEQRGLQVDLSNEGPSEKLSFSCIIYQ